MTVRVGFLGAGLIATYHGKSLRRSGDTDRAIAAYDALLIQNPASLDAKEGKALALIVKGDFDTPATLLGEVMTDIVLRGPITRFADSRIEGAAPTWVYEFRWRSPVDGLGAAHAMELGFVFDRLDTPDAVALGGTDGPRALADAMHGAWVSFIRDGDPGWERWSELRPVQAFDADGGHIDYAPRQDELAGLPER